MLVNFDLINLLRGVNIDDSFYYFKTAQNLAAGQFSTVDGGITRTNGYHPIWMFLLTPFYYGFDAESALFAIKAFEIMLIAGGVALLAGAARLAGLPWYLLFAALPLLYQVRPLYWGMEAAAALFWLGLFFLALILFARNPGRGKWALVAVAFSLPWVRLELVAVSVAATAGLCLIEWFGKDRPPAASLRERIGSLSRLDAVVPFSGAWAGLFVYFAYNYLLFGGFVPVSSIVKILNSTPFPGSAAAAEGFDIVRRIQNYWRVPVVRHGALASVAIGVIAAVVWHTSLRTARRCGALSQESLLFMAFLAGAVGLAVGHLGRSALSVLTLRYAVEFSGASSWYFVPAWLMAVLLVPIVCFATVHLVRLHVAPKHGCMARLLQRVCIAGCALHLLTTTDFTRPFGMIDSDKTNLGIGHLVRLYAGVQIMNRVLSTESIVGSWGSGVVGYFFKSPVVNLDGLMNSYEYMNIQRRGRHNRRDRGASEYLQFYKQASLTHFAEVRDVDRHDENMLFGGDRYRHERTGIRHEFRLWSAEPVDESDWFWERMTPHFDHLSDDVGIVLNGRLVQAFARDCQPERLRDARLVFSWTTGRGETLARHWRPFIDTSRNQVELCAAMMLLPHGAAHPIRIETIYEP